jgi:excisionase family DNA binding protein
MPVRTSDLQTYPPPLRVHRRLLRTKEAAEYLCVSPWKLRRLIQDGRLPVVQDGDGSPFLLDVRDLDSYIDRNKKVLPF